MQDLNKLVDVAIEYRIAKLKAEEQGIIGVTDCGGKRESFQVYNKDDFKEMIKTRPYTISRNGEYYEYKTKVAGLNFICLTLLLFKKEDRKYIPEVEDV
jgi:hypothetical protein